MDDRNDRRRDRLSWAEIDKLRDKSRSRDRDPMQKQSSPVALNAQRSYRAALERAFASGKLGELAKTLSRTGEDVRPPAPPGPPPPAAAPGASPTSATAPTSDAEPESAASLGNATGAGAGATAAGATAAGATGAGATAAGATAAGATAAAPAGVARDPEREAKQKLLAKIREAEGREAVTRAVDAFVAKYPKLPDDVEILTKCLGHRSDDRVRCTLDQLSTLVERDKPRRARTLVAQLRILEDTHGDPDIRAQAGRVRARL